LRLSGDANLYVSAAKGFRSGGLNYAAGLPAYGPEDVWTYEAGAKFSALSGRLRADIALFYSDYRDYQIFGTVPLPTPLAITSNAGDAEIKGVEWSLLFRPASDWTVTLDGTLLDSKFTSINALSTSHDVGDPLDLFPDYSFSASLQRDVRWMDKPGYVRIDFSEHGPERYRNRNFSGSFGPPTPWYYDKSDVIQLLNVSGRLDWSRNLSFGLFAQNLLNDRGQSTPRSLEGNAGRPRPLTVGVEFSVAFD